MKPIHPVRWQQMPCSFVICLHTYILEGSEESPHVTHTSKGGRMDGSSELGTGVVVVAVAVFQIMQT